MEAGDHRHFATKDEEIVYWKQFVERLMNEKDALQHEFDEYTSNSAQLEKEYDAMIEQNEKTIRELRTMCQRERCEKESLHMKLEQAVHEAEAATADVERTAAECAAMAKTIRLLEQKNDDLERSERMVAETVAAIEGALNTAIERNAILESEIDEKESLKEKLQRLVDETRDLKQELHVKDRCPDNERVLNGHTSATATMTTSAVTTATAAATATTTAATAMTLLLANGCPTNGVDSNRLQVESADTQTTPAKRETSSTRNNGASLLDRPLTPSSRVLALNIIGELMRKIGLSRFLCDGCGQVKCTRCPAVDAKVATASAPAAFDPSNSKRS